MDTKGVAAIVVLYHPAGDVAARIIGYSKFLNKVIVVDNTDGYDRPESFKTIINNIVYMPLYKNYGVAYALNIGVQKAIALGYSWAILLDQDSTLDESVLRTTTNAIVPGVGIISPVQISRNKERDRLNNKTGTADVLFTMTSGSIINLQAYRVCGGFDEKLFIDFVDHEYCLRNIKNGYRVMQCFDAVLAHSLGNVKQVKFLGLHFEITSHKPFRLYFFTRNGLHVSLKYFCFRPMVAVDFLRHITKEIVKTLLFEDEKLLREK